ncbi:MAG TPA: hypothetical protein VFX59_14935 [Polyangiales bacterium]|nr:hypothetical protein [Polyangiales bacterium]
MLEELAGLRADASLARAERLQKLRGVAIGRLIEELSDGFLDVAPQLLRGEPAPELCGDRLQHAKALARTRIYTAQSVVERLLGGQAVLAALLDALAPVVDALAEVGFDRARLRGARASIAHLFGPGFAPRDRYQALLGVTDFLSALTDRGALALHRRLAGLD